MARLKPNELFLLEDDFNDHIQIKKIEKIKRTKPSPEEKKIKKKK
jgi:hypothetical protein